MKKQLTITALSLVAFLSITNTASAKFIGLVVEDITDNSLGLSEYALYAVFDDPMDSLNIVFDANIFTTTGFFHNSIGGKGQSALPFTTEQTSMSDYPDADSFVTIGLMTGDDNVTILAPSFDEDSFINGNNLGFNATWLNSFPPNGQGIPGPDGLVLIAVFTPLNDGNGIAGIVSGELSVGYNANGKGLFGKGSFITPTPGTLGLFVMAVFLGKRRRRT